MSCLCKNKSLISDESIFQAYTDVGNKNTALVKKLKSGTLWAQTSNAF